MAATDAIYIRFPVDLAAQVRAAAEAEKISLNEYIVRALAEYLTGRKN